MKGIRLDPADVAIGRAQWHILLEWIVELWTARDDMSNADKQYRARLAELMDEVATLRAHSVGSWALRLRSHTSRRTAFG
jgi:hypothetical protein